MRVVYSRNRVPIRLTVERWQHIVAYHQELDGRQDEVLETVAEPEQIQIGDYGELLAFRFYGDTPLGGKFLVVAYRELSDADGFILTAYYTRRLSIKREMLWKH
ncbi:MAG: hypothetical protein HYY48_11320 [Gammaproteobacteria bacterium]|nr:hypothetical protein [Gammaproteobacteria bacterium]